jgi:hypothetical protein
MDARPLSLTSSVTMGNFVNRCDMSHMPKREQGISESMASGAVRRQIGAIDRVPPKGGGGGGGTWRVMACVRGQKGQGQRPEWRRCIAR